MRRFAREAAAALLALAFALLVGGLFVAARGHPLGEVYATWFGDALFTPGGRAQVVFKATTLSATGLAALLAFRAGLFNIGAEGQLYGGCFAAALAAIALPPELPGVIAQPLVVLAALGGGAIVALVPAWLRASRGASEVITTMMMNFVAAAGVNAALGLVRESPDVVRTASVPGLWRFPRMERGFDGSAAILVVVGAALVVGHVLARMRLGFWIDTLGARRSVAVASGHPVRRVELGVLLASGALAGLGGVNFVLGSPGYFEQGFAPGQGFLGIAVALVARNDPLALVPAAFAFALLAEGAQSLQALAPPELGLIVQALTVIGVLVASRALGAKRAS